MVLLDVHNWHVPGVVGPEWFGVVVRVRAGAARGLARSERRCLGDSDATPSPGPGARARPYQSGDAESHGGTGEAVHRGVSFGDSDAIRVRIQAWEPGRIGVAETRVSAGRGDPCTAGGKEVAGGGEPCRLGDVIEVVKVRGRAIGPGWRLRREPGPRE